MRDDAYARHPELRGLITDPDRSAMRGFDPHAFATSRPELRLEMFLTPPAAREASRQVALAKCEDDLWVFGYGSLMWNPAFRFIELRRAHVADHARRFILKDSFGGRGTAEKPGLLAALDRGAGCDGLVFRIAAGAGFFGSSLDYLTNIAAHFAVLGIEDSEIAILMRETAAYLADHAKGLSGTI